MKQATKDAKEFKTKHEEELKRLQEQFKATSGTIAAMVHVRSLYRLVYQFMREYKHTNFDNEKQCQYTIEKALDVFDIELSDEEFENVVSSLTRSLVKPSIQKQAKEQVKQTKHQEKRQYPTTYSTSKPSKPKDITTTSKPKLNLSHVQQVHQPNHVLPSENNRKLSVSSSSYHGRDNNVDYSFGLVEGIEADNRIYNSELKQYREALKSIG